MSSEFDYVSNLRFSIFWITVNQKAEEYDSIQAINNVMLKYDS